MKKIISILSLGSILSSSMATAQYERLEYSLLNHETFYAPNETISIKEEALSYIENARSEAAWGLIPTKFIQTVSGYAVGYIGLKFMPPGQQFHSTFSVFVLPVITALSFSYAGGELMTLLREPICKTIPQTLSHQLGFYFSYLKCDSLLKPDKMTELEALLTLKWKKLRKNIREDLADNIFNARGAYRSSGSSHSHESMKSGDDIVKSLKLALQLPMDPKEVSYNPSLLDRLLQGIDPLVISTIKRIVFRHAIQSKLPEGKKSSLFFQGPPGTGKTETARKIAQALGLQYCEISLTNGMSSLMGSKEHIGGIADCLLKQESTNPVIIINEADRGLDSRDLSELLMLSDPQQKTLEDVYLGVEIPLDRLMIIYTVNNDIEDSAFHDRVTSLLFNGFSLDYRIAYIQEQYMQKLFSRYGSPSIISKNDITTLIEDWAQGQRQRNITLSGMRSVEADVENLFLDLLQEKTEAAALETLDPQVNSGETHSEAEKREQDRGMPKRNEL